ncbi:MAG: arginine--tRNA ligase, partial [Firmicutes bacterium]|nr:arginine--tRNA ligase [Bacillota bacterium]
LMGYAWADDIVHIPYGLMSFEWGKMSTRKGRVIKMTDILDEAVKKTKQIIEEKNPELPDKDRVAEMVGLGAVTFAQLYNNRIKDVSFSWERYLNFDGETGPYLQYAYVRTCGVLEKAEAVYPGYDYPETNYAMLSDEYSFEVIRRAGEFPGKLIEAAEKYEPYIVSRHLIALAQAFNRFYHENPVVVEDEKLRGARLALTSAVKTILGKGLGILGIARPEKM